MFSSRPTIHTADEDTPCFFIDATVKFITDCTTLPKKESQRSILVTLFSRLLSSSASVYAIGPPSCHVARRTNRGASIKTINFFLEVIWCLKPIPFIQKRLRCSFSKNAEATRRSTCTVLGTIYRDDGCDEWCAFVWPKQYARKDCTGEKCEHCLYIAQPNLRVANQIDLEEWILPAIMSNIKFCHPLSHTCSVRDTIIKCCCYFKDLIFRNHRGRHILSLSVDGALRDHLLGS